MKIWIVLILFFSWFCIQAQESIVWIQFKYKNNLDYSLQKPKEYLSELSIQRREIQNISIDSTDLPVNKSYLKNIEEAGFKIRFSSKWFNAVSAICIKNENLGKLNTFSFVKNWKITKPLNTKNSYSEKSLYIPENKPYDSIYYGLSYPQLSMNNIPFLHQMGWQGEGVRIAVLDAGFFGAKSTSSLLQLFNNQQVLDTFNFIDPNISVFNYSEHGTMVLSLLGGNRESVFVGSAPKAYYLLYATEDVNSEYQVEEDNWIAAAERADSLGVDIISSSLGYNTFWDVNQNYNYKDMNGKTARISQAATMAANKGILVVSSAGNEGTKPWKYITAPADADKILTVGAVNNQGVKTGFSSVGYTSDGRVKPDVATLGQNNVVNTKTGFFQSNGTSFSAPIIAGMAACLWQINRKISAEKLREIIQFTSSQYISPDSLIGYGIPNAKLAYYQLLFGVVSHTYHVFPNPAKNFINVHLFSEKDKNVDIEIFDLKGVKLSDYQNKTTFDGHNFFTISTQNLAIGVYILRVNFENNKGVVKFVKE